MFIQSLDQYVCRYLANKYYESYKSIYVIGLQFSLPVFLFRDPMYMSKIITENNKFNQFFIERAFKIKSTKKFNMGLASLRKIILEKIEYIFDILFLNSKFRKSRLVKATSYVKKGVVDFHLVGSSYYKFCLNQIYDEPIEIINTYKSKSSYISSNLLELNKEYDLIFLGPVSDSMLNDYLTDIRLLIKRGFAFGKIYVKAHPRFKELANKLIRLLINEFDEKSFIKIDLIHDIDLNKTSLVVIGYYSSLFDELLHSNFHGISLISERATRRRYPFMPVKILSGQEFGFNNSHTTLGLDGDFIK